MLYKISQYIHNKIMTLLSLRFNVGTGGGFNIFKLAMATDKTHI